MDRLLVCEFQPFAVQADGAGSWQQTQIPTNYEQSPVASSLWFSEQIIDLTGYQMADMTAYFRQSFQQRGSVSVLGYAASASAPLALHDASFLEYVIVSTVPISSENMAASITAAPGFIGFGQVAGLFDYGNFDRTAIVHGRMTLYGVDTSITLNSTTASGFSYVRVIEECDFSSLEPTAVDKLYCYRYFSLPVSDRDPLNPSGLLDSITVAPARVLLDANFAKEEEIPYLMRLKRGYELANQV